MSILEFGITTYLSDVKTEIETAFWIIVGIIFLVGIAMNLSNIYNREWKTVLGQLFVFLLIVVLIIVAYNYITTRSF